MSRHQAAAAQRRHRQGCSVPREPLRDLRARARRCLPELQPRHADQPADRREEAASESVDGTPQHPDYTEVY